MQPNSGARDRDANEIQKDVSALDGEGPQPPSYSEEAAPTTTKAQAPKKSSHTKVTKPTSYTESEEGERRQWHDVALSIMHNPDSLLELVKGNFEDDLDKKFAEDQILSSAMIWKSFGKKVQRSFDKSDIEKINSKLARIVKIAKGKGILPSAYKCPQLRSMTHS